jgi:hypothetical protein
VAIALFIPLLVGLGQPHMQVTGKLMIYRPAMLEECPVLLSTSMSTVTSARSTHLLTFPALITSTRSDSMIVFSRCLQGELASYPIMIQLKTILRNRQYCHISECWTPNEFLDCTICVKINRRSRCGGYSETNAVLLGPWTHNLRLRQEFATLRM